MPQHKGAIPWNKQRDETRPKIILNAFQRNNGLSEDK
jgi:hypothetical protein